MRLWRRADRAGGPGGDATNRQLEPDILATAYGRLCERGENGNLGLRTARLSTPHVAPPTWKFFSKYTVGSLHAAVVIPQNIDTLMHDRRCGGACVSRLGQPHSRVGDNGNQQRQNRGGAEPGLWPGSRRVGHRSLDGRPSQVPPIGDRTDRRQRPVGIPLVSDGHGRVRVVLWPAASGTHLGKATVGCGDVVPQRVHMCITSDIGLRKLWRHRPLASKPLHGGTT